METVGYLYLWLVALIAAVLFGVASHWAHANLQAFPEKPVDGFAWRDHFLNDFLNEDYVWWGEYDEGGWWRFDSLRNFMSHVVPLAFVVLLGGLWFWDERAQVVATTCAKVALIGMKPLFCN